MRLCALRSESRLERLSADYPRANRASGFTAKLYHAVEIPTEVYHEVVIAGAGLPGAAAVSKADWIHVTPVRKTEDLMKAITKAGLGAGEMSAIFLAKELSADLTLMDEWKGRRLAIEEGWR